MTCYNNGKGAIEFGTLPIIGIAAVKNTPADENGRYDKSNQVPETTIEFLIFSDQSISTLDDHDEITDSHSEILEPGQDFTEELKAEMAGVLRRRMANRKLKKSA